MKTIPRLAVISLVATAALALAGNAFATQRISVLQTTSSLTIKVSQDVSDQQPAKISIYVPSTFTLTPNGAVGSKIGTTSGIVFARDLSLQLPLTGDVLVLDPAAHMKDACSPGAHLAVWDLHLTVAGQAIDLPVYLTATSGAEATFGPAKLETCLGPADVPAGTPGRSPNGAQLLEATFTVNNQIKPPFGSSRWISLWTPYAAGTGVPNPAGTVEARSIAGAGGITIVGRVVSKKQKLLKIKGRVTQGGIPVAGVVVRLFLNAKPRFKTTTASNGGYTFRLKNKNPRVSTTFFQAMATAAPRDVTSSGCDSPSVPGVKCVSATAGPFTATSKKLRIHL